MRRLTSALAAACTAMLLTSSAALAQGTIESRLTNVTFSGPVSLPGKTLPAGTYQFRLADSPSNRNIVQVFDEHGAQLIATFLAIPADRVEAQGDPVITFKETRSDQPPAVHYWYYAGERSGSELVYPKSQAMQIARTSGESVMSMDTESTDVNDLKNSKLSRIDASAAAQPETTAQQPPATATAPTTPATTTAPTTPATTTAPTTTTPAEPAQPAQPPATTYPSTTTRPSTTSQPDMSGTTGTSGTRSPGTSGTSGTRARRALPHTASPLPMIGLIGLLAFAGALGVRAYRRVNG